MTFEHWTGVDGDALVERDHPQMAFLLAGMEFCCAIESETYAGAMRQYHEHMGWGPYKTPSRSEE